MSHLTKGDLFVTDLEALVEATPKAGLEFRRGQTTWRSYYGERVSEHALAVKGGKSEYEIGVVPVTNEKGVKGYELNYDQWGLHGQAIEKVAGPHLENLKHAYATAVAVKRARAKYVPKGWAMKQIAMPGGRTLLRLQKG